MCSRFFLTTQSSTVPAQCRYVDVARHLSYSTDLTMSLSPTDISPLSPDDSMRRRRHQQLHMVHVRRTCCIHTCCIEHASTPPLSMLNSVPSDLARSPFHSHLFFQRFPSLSSSSAGDFLTMGRRAKLAVKRERERTKKGRKKVATTRRRVVHNFSHRFLFKRWEHGSDGSMALWTFGLSLTVTT